MLSPILKVCSLLPQYEGCEDGLEVMEERYVVLQLVNTYSVWVSLSINAWRDPRTFICDLWSMDYPRLCCS